MTLFKQIALLVTLLFLILSAVYFVGDVNRSGNFLQGQLQTMAQDMTTTLGIVISNMPDGDDPASLEVLFNSVFDSGYYTNIELISVQGEVIHRKSQEVHAGEVPPWFIDWLALQSASGSTAVIKGWMQLGELRLTLHPGFAVSGLYESFLSTVKWFMVVMIAGISVLWLVLHFILRPLQRVRLQAEAISRNEFVQQDKLPATQELRRVVSAMNRMVIKIQNVFTEQEKNLTRYQSLLYQDKYSGLGNRRYMMEQLQEALQESSSFNGCLGFIKLVNFAAAREQLGYQQSDVLIKTMVGLLEQSYSGVKADKTARLSDDEFAVLVAADQDTIRSYLEGMFEDFKQAPQPDGLEESLYLVAGTSDLQSGMGLGDLLSNVDYCMARSMSFGPYQIQQKSEAMRDLPQGKMQWRQWLEMVIQNRQLFLVAQTVVGIDKQPVQRELFIRCRDERGEVIPASAFLPMASQLGMAIDIDKAVFTLVQAAAGGNDIIPMALNLSPDFFELAGAQEEFNEMLRHCQEKSVSLCIEASHHVLNQHPKMCRKISARVRAFGHQFGIDSLDLGQPLHLLQSTGCSYVKINAGALNNGEDSAGYHALKTMTDTLDIIIILVGIDSIEMFESFKSLGIEFMQGNLLGQPEAL